jgi:thiol-disulfide isomerase/thioredoxin
MFAMVLIASMPASLSLAQAQASREDAWLKQVLAGQRSQVLKETDAALQAASNPEERAGILFVRGRAQILEADLAAAEKTIEAFRLISPSDERGAELQFRIAKATTEPTSRRQRFARAAELYPTSYWGKMSAGAIVQIDSIGKPFELDFKDAITGRAVSLQRDFKGKVVVVLFWASWCPDCNAATPKLKQVYEKYRTRGVEFIGVSLDEPEAAGGLESLKQYVAAKQIPWPQFYQGNRFDSAFSQRWGVSSTPTSFLVEAEGKLVQTNVPVDPEPAIVELLAKRDTNANRPG